MQLLKNMKASIVALFIILVVYNVVIFVIPFHRNASFWTGYVFTMLAFFLTEGVCIYAVGREGLKSKFYGVPFVYVAWYYLIAQAPLGLLEMILYFIPFQYGIAANVILLGACFLGLITVDIAKEEVERLDKRTKEKIFFIKTLQIHVDGLTEKTKDEQLRKKLKDLTETIRYSDPMSNFHLEAIENEIEGKILTLAEFVDKAESGAAMATCTALQQLFSNEIGNVK